MALDEAVQLFAQRAAAVRPGAGADVESVAGICRRLDGLPLAIELAAARVKALPVREIAARLDDRFQLLTAPPARTSMHPVAMTTSNGRSAVTTVMARRQRRGPRPSEATDAARGLAVADPPGQRRQILL